MIPVRITSAKPRAPRQPRPSGEPRRIKPDAAPKRSKAEAQLENHIRGALLPDPATEHAFHHRRRWRFDFAWPALKLAVEVEGGVYSGGRHTRGSGYEADCEKYNTAALLGWRVLRVTPRHVRSGLALRWIEQAMGARPV